MDPVQYPSPPPACETPAYAGGDIFLLYRKSVAPYPQHVRYRRSLTAQLERSQEFLLNFDGAEEKDGTNTVVVVYRHVLQVPYIHHFEPSLDASSFRPDVISPTKIHFLPLEKPPGRVSPASLPFDTNLRQQGLYPHGGLPMYFKTTHITPR